jgi:hypothetical protein
MKIFVTYIQGGIESVWCEEVPADLSDDDVRYSVEQAAQAGDRVAADALPHIRINLCRYRTRSSGVRVYLD